VNGWPKLKANVDDILAISTEEYPTPAARPQNSKLDNTKLKSVFKLELPSWQQGLQQVMQNIQIAEK
jgi:dTDP-4-dehydrorhamnose reductase